MRIEDLERELILLSSKNNKLYIDKVVGKKEDIFGVSIPNLRKIGKKVVKEDYKDFFDNCPNTYFEYRMLKGIVLGYAKDDIEIILNYVKKFVLIIDDWALNDVFCSGFKICRKYLDRVWDFLMEYVSVDEEYPQRMVAVMLLNYYLNDEYIDRTLDVFTKLKNNGYYTKMAVAWGVATAYCKYPDKVLKLLDSKKLDNWVHNKAIQKCIESLKVSDRDKEMLRNLKITKRYNSTI